VKQVVGPVDPDRSEAWFHRVGSVGRGDLGAQLVVVGAVGVPLSVVLEVAELRSDSVVFRVGCHAHGPLEQLAVNLAWLGIEIHWLAVRECRSGCREAQASRRSVQAVSAECGIEGTRDRADSRSLPEYEPLVDRVVSLGRAAANAVPESDASRRSRKLLALVYLDLTGATAPF
jgi:hypothetical protein